MFTAKEINRIEDYIYGRLSEEESKKFVAEMDNNAALEQEVFLRQLIQETAEEDYLVNLLEEAKEDTNLGDFIANLKAIDETHHTNLQDLLKEETASTYTLDELLTMFRPIAEYEEMLVTAERAETGDIEVENPVNGQNCHTELAFSLKRPLTTDFKVRIENNQMQAVWKQRFKASTTTFTVATDSFPPGRYYWKLWNQSGLVMGVFFVRKELLAVN